MNLELKDIPKKIQPVLQKLKGYAGFIIILLVLSAYGFLILQIRSYALKEPDPSTVSEELTALNLPKIDEEKISRIEQLEETNVEVKALFEQARNNPFQE